MTPPGSERSSNTVTAYPSFASSAAQDRPAGPEPTTATFSGRAGFFARGSKPICHECSTRNRWIFPIAIGRTMPVALHSFSHRRAVGHSTPQAPPSALLVLIVRMAPLTLRRRSLRMKVAGSVSAGHPFEQGASWQSRQRSASARAWTRPKPFSMVLNRSVTLTRSLLGPDALPAGCGSGPGKT